MSTHLPLIPFAPSAEHSQTLLGSIECTTAFKVAVEDVQAHSGRDVPLNFNTYLGEDRAERGAHYCNTQEDWYGGSAEARSCLGTASHVRNRGRGRKLACRRVLGLSRLPAGRMEGGAVLALREGAVH
jgi:hypothetical protein